MRSGTKIAVGITFLAAVVAASAIPKIYFVREDSGGEVLWNTDQAYLFIGVTRRGFHCRYLQYPWVVFQGYVGAPPPADDERTSRTVIRVTQSGVERHVLDIADNVPGASPDFYTPLDGHIYANCTGVLCRWTGGTFETASEDENRRVGINHLIPDIDTEVQGWSKRGIGAGPQSNFARLTADVGGIFTLSETSEEVGIPGYAAVAVYLKRPGQAREKIWYLDGHPRRVSKPEYEQVFGPR